jgi:hypothetical protein
MPLSRIAFAEAMRHVVSLSGVSDPREAHAKEGDGLVVWLTWRAVLGAHARQRTTM